MGAGDGKRQLLRHIQFRLQQVARHGDIMMDRVGGLECGGNGRYHLVTSLLIVVGMCNLHSER